MASFSFSINTTSALSAGTGDENSSTVQFEVLGTTFTVPKHYSPLKALGKGAYGVVCAAKNKLTGEKVAIKRVSPAAATRSDGLHTLREVRLIRWLGKHPQVIGLKDFFVSFEHPSAPAPPASTTSAPPASTTTSASAKDEVYLVSELFDTDLHRIITSSQPLGDAHYKHFMYQLLRGLRFAHANGCIHRDLKPANLLVTKACDLVISDFGLARMMPEGEGQAMTEHVVTRWYRAPELMLSADGSYSTAVDIWSCGCILAELLGRQPLFAGKDFVEVCGMQISVLGTRPEEELRYIRSDQALQFLHGLPFKPKVQWSSLYPEASSKVLDLLDKLLQFHPSKRPTAEEAMGHPYFDSVRSQYTDPEPVLPLGVGGFEFSFENDPTLQPDDFKRLLVAEAVSFKAERAWLRATGGGAGGTGGAAAGGGGGIGAVAAYAGAPAAIASTAVPSASAAPAAATAVMGGGGGFAGGGGGDGSNAGPVTMVGANDAASSIAGGGGAGASAGGGSMLMEEDDGHSHSQQYHQPSQKQQAIKASAPGQPGSGSGSGGVGLTAAGPRTVR